jgi:S-adenosylmethionine:tRNA ribosyltransferase-isomerase
MGKDLFSLSAYEFTFPSDLIAQHPAEPRDQSRLMIVDRHSGLLSEIRFSELTDFLEAGDSLVLNDTKVIPARLLGQRDGGGNTEIFLLKRLSFDTWEALARPGKKLRTGSRVVFSDPFHCLVINTLENGNKILQFEWEGAFESALAAHGQIPLPSYIRQGAPTETDSASYQTVFAKNPGAVAAPTAGLHFTESLLNDLSARGVDRTWITLHVGLGTFRPVKTQDIRSHTMHTESFIITPEAAEKLNKVSPAKRQICIGTTCCRSLESAVTSEGKIVPGEYETDIFIYPGYQFKYVRSMITNFHLPGSTLLMLVSTFGGYDLIMEAYAKAIEQRFRFYSYGDAMLIL